MCGAVGECKEASDCVSELVLTDASTSACSLGMVGIVLELRSLLLGVSRMTFKV